MVRGCHMDADWLKPAKTVEEEKAQFHRLYQVLSSLSRPESRPESQAMVPVPPKPSPPKPPRGPMDFFLTLRSEVEESLSRGPFLSVCQACDTAFDTGKELADHETRSRPCQEWKKKGYQERRTDSFFDRMEKGIQSLFVGGRCRFCERMIPHRKAQERHYMASVACNRLAFMAFEEWMRGK